MADSSITEQIALKTAAIASAQQAASQLRQSASEWQTQSEAGCSGKIGNKKKDCEADKAFKASKAQQNRDLAAVEDTKVQNLQREIKVLEDQQKAQNETTVNLSTHGQSLESLIVESKGRADATIAAATTEAQARAAAITTGAAADADSQQKFTWIAIGIGILFLIILAFFIYKKVKSKKRK